LELSTKITNLSSIRNELISRKKLYGDISRKSNATNGMLSTLRSTGFTGLTGFSGFSGSSSVKKI